MSPPSPPPTPNPNPSPEEPLRLPGFGLHVEWCPFRGTQFPRPDRGFSKTALTLREMCMLVFMDQITDKPGWNEKVFNDEIVGKWKAEALAINWADAGVPGGSFTEQMFDYCIRELQDKAKLLERTGFIVVLDVDQCVVKSDSAVPPELKQALREAVAPLENVPEDARDWHPGTNNVLDLVHPSLYPLVYGRTRVLPHRRLGLEEALAACGTGEVIPRQTSYHSSTLSFDKEAWSLDFQWLPCEVEFPDGSREAKITSYINNLHPRQHAGLYGVLERLISKSVPLWNAAYKTVMGGDKTKRHRIPCMEIETECLLRTDGTGCDGWCCDLRPLNPGEGEDERDTDEDERWRQQHHRTKQPNPAEYSAPPSVAGDGFEDGGLVDVAGRKLQVIVKLANIHLTPERPRYEGGTWHVEGQVNEHICATALYYYDSDNITDSRLAFRVALSEYNIAMSLQYEQGDFDGITAVFGFENDEPAIQERGGAGVSTPEGRLLVFPNVMQHCVAPFELADRSRPGHRKIVALFLVDPACRVLSTANVPPQQRDWWLEGIAKEMPDGRLGRLPPELSQMVIENTDSVMSREEAEHVRWNLMRQRTRRSEEAIDRATTETWNFCEHR